MPAINLLVCQSIMAFNADNVGQQAETHSRRAILKRILYFSLIWIIKVNSIQSMERE